MWASDEPDVSPVFLLPRNSDFSCFCLLIISLLFDFALQSLLWHFCHPRIFRSSGSFALGTLFANPPCFNKRPSFLKSYVRVTQAPGRTALLIHAYDNAEHAVYPPQ